MDTVDMNNTKYITNQNAKVHLRWVEWEAYRYLVFNRDWNRIGEAFPNQRSFSLQWADYYNLYRDKHAKNPEALALHALLVCIVKGEIADLDEFYKRLHDEVTYRKRGTSLKDQSKRIAKKAATKEAYAAKGESFVDNNRLISMTKRAAVSLVHTSLGEPHLTELLEELVSQCSKTPLQADEMTTLHSIFNKKIKAMEQSISEGEAAILRNPNKKLAKDATHLYSLFKLNCEVNDTWELSQLKLCKALGANRHNSLAAAELLENLGLVKILEKGKAGTVNQKSTIYKRLA